MISASIGNILSFSIYDTPGVITNEEKIKFNLEESLLSDPYQACFDTDLIIVVHDVSNRFVREAIPKPILGLLCRNPEIPAILVLNKLDTIPKSKRVYDLIRKLTCGRLNGVEQGIRINKGPAKKLTLDDYFKKREKRFVLEIILTLQIKFNNNILRVSSKDTKEIQLGYFFFKISKM